MTTGVLRHADARDSRTLAGVLVATVVATLALGISAPTLALAGTLVVVGWIVLWRLGWTTLTWWMVWLTPFQAAFVIDIGITLRLSFLAGLAAVAMAAASRRLVWFKWHRASRWMAAFLAVVLLATVVMTPLAPVHSLAAQSGWRGLPVMRPLIQCLQLLAMVGIMTVVAYQARDPLRAHQLFRAMWVSGLLVSVYGAYMFIAPVIGIPAIDINNAMNTNFSRGGVQQGTSIGSVVLPRVRSTFVEPLNFANYLLAVFGGLWVLLQLAARKGRYRLALAFVAFLFLVAVNSRGAIFGVLVASVAMVPFAANPLRVIRTLFRTGIVVAVFAVLVLAVMPWIIPGLETATFQDFLVGRMVAAASSDSRLWFDVRTAGEVIARYPVFGVGFGNIPFHLAALGTGSTSGVVDAGSIYTRLAAETGIVGLLLFLAFFGSVLRSLIRTGRSAQSSVVTRTMSRALYFVLVADAIQRVSHVGIATDVHLWVMYGLAIGLAYRPAPDGPTPERRT